MSLEHFNSLRDRSCEMWIEAESAIISLNERANFHSKRSTLLGWSTVASGVLAGGSGIGFLSLFGLQEATTTVIFGFATAGIAGINQAYKPSEKEKTLSEMRGNILTIQRDIKTDLWKLKSKAQLSVDDDFSVDQASDKLDEHLMRLPIDQSRHHDVARLNLERKKYHLMQYAPVETSSVPPSVEIQMINGDEIAGVRPFGRGGA